MDNIASPDNGCDGNNCVAAIFWPLEVRYGALHSGNGEHLGRRLELLDKSASGYGTLHSVSEWLKRWPHRQVRRLQPGREILEDFMRGKRAILCTLLGMRVRQDQLRSEH